MKKIIKKTNKIKGNVKYARIFTCIVVVALLFLIIFLNLNNNEQQYIVQKGSIENVEPANAYVIKQETVIDKDTSKIIIPVVVDGQKTSKGNVIATYKGKEYENYKEEIEKMDKKILELMKDLPIVYSSDIESIENQINKLIKESKNENSYIKMQEYKTQINLLISKRAELVGNLSPDGAAVKEQIKKRNKYVEVSKKSNDNVIATVSGIVSYQTDGLEKKLICNNIDKLSYTSVADLADDINVDNTKIKIVNNFKAYIIAKVSKKNSEYMKKNKKYNIKVVGNDEYIFETTLYKIEEKDNYYEVIFKILDGIEYLINEREVEIEIVWWNNTRIIC